MNQSRRQLLRLGGFVSSGGLAGCTATDFLKEESDFLIEIVTYYDSDLAGSSGEKAAKLGFSPDDAATRGDARLIVKLYDGQSNLRGADAKPVPRGETLPPQSSGDVGRYSMPLDENGRVAFRLQTTYEPYIQVWVAGSFEAEDCRDGLAKYTRGPFDVASLTPPKIEPVEEDAKLPVPFAIVC